MSGNFYREFEDKFRGSREVIKSRSHVYLPFFTPLRDRYPNSRIVDLGCGRGEWLELLRESGFSSCGVDSDEGMLAACRELDLDVESGDALRYLKEIPDECLLGVTGFHLAEHIPFADLQTLVEQALRVLVPGGLLILETPNPENLVVGATNFYLDPTHVRPLPPLLLEFLPEYYGFQKTKVLRLQEQPGIGDNKKLQLFAVLGGVSPDYAVVAQKQAPRAILKLTKNVFETEYGVTLEQLATSYSEQVGQIAERDTGLSQQSARVESLREELKAESLRVANLAKELAVTKVEASYVSKDFSKQIQEVEVEKATLIEQQAVSQQTWQRALSAARSRQEELSGEHAATKMELERSACDYASTKMELDDLAGEHAATKIELERFAAVHASTKMELDDLAGEHAATKIELERFAGDHASTKMELGRLAGEHVATKMELERLVENADALNLEIGNLKETISTKSQLLENTERDVKEQRIELEKAHCKSHALEREGFRLEKELRAVVGSISWRLTWPIRKLWPFVVWLLSLPGRVLRGLFTGTSAK